MLVQEWKLNKTKQKNHHTTIIFRGVWLNALLILHAELLNIINVLILTSTIMESVSTSVSYACIFPPLISWDYLLLISLSPISSCLPGFLIKCWLTTSSLFFLFRICSLNSWFPWWNSNVFNFLKLSSTIFVLVLNGSIEFFKLLHQS